MDPGTNSRVSLCVLAVQAALLDSMYGTERGLAARSEIRAEINELITQLEAKNPTPSPTDVSKECNSLWHSSKSSRSSSRSRSDTAATQTCIYDVLTKLHCLSAEGQQWDFLQPVSQQQQCSLAPMRRAGWPAGARHPAAAEFEPVSGMSSCGCLHHEQEQQRQFDLLYK